MYPKLRIESANHRLAGKDANDNVAQGVLLTTLHFACPGRGIQPIFSEEYVEKEKDAHMLICTFPFIATFVFLLSTLHNPRSVTNTTLATSSTTTSPPFDEIFKFLNGFFQS